MLARTGSLCTAARRYRRSSASAAAVASALLLLGSAAWAAGPAASGPAAALSLLKTIPINGTAASPKTQMFSFDISWVDQTTGLFYIADRSNAAVDVINTKTDTLFGQIGGPSVRFAGDTGTTATSGPNGVVTQSPSSTQAACLFVTDAAGRTVSFNTSVSFTAIVSSVSAVPNPGTTVPLRGDELAYDPADGVLLVINNADTPPFGTLISVNKTTCALTLGTKIVFNAANHVNATNGAEQPVWEPMTKKFYLSIPEVDGDGSGAFFKGAVAQIDPKSTGAVDGLYQINFMQPAGLTVGPNGDLLVGSNSVFDIAANMTDSLHKCTAVVATASTPARIVPPICGTTAGPEEAICNPGKGCRASNGSLVAVQGVGGGDEVWFNSGDGNYYVTAGNDPAAPVIGVIASGVNTLTQKIPTLYAQQAVGVVGGTPPFVHSAGTVHSVAASAANNHVYVPLPANTAYPNCLQGCIAVFGVGP